MQFHLTSDNNFLPFNHCIFESYFQPPEFALRKTALLDDDGGGEAV
jgi:hypothetical protein